MQVELEARRNPEVPTAAAECPEQLGVLVGARTHDATVRSHEVGADEVVARQAVLRRQVPDAAAERQPADPRRTHDAARRDEPDGLRRAVEVEPGRAALSACDPPVAVHRDASHAREVDHEPTVEHAVARGVVPSSAHGDIQIVGTCEIERGRDVGGAETPRDQTRPAIDEGVEADARGVVLGVSRDDDGAAERAPKLGHLL